MSQIVTKAIEDAIKSVSDELEKKGFPKLPVDKNPPMGDFAIICFPAAKTLKMSPDQVSKKISLEIHNNKLVKRAVNVKGYCNIDINWNTIANSVIKELKDPKYGSTNVKPEKILIEHTSANPTGPFHMGRARNPIIGDSLARLLSYYGHNVDTEYYVNDTGRQAATLAYGISNYEPKGKNKIDHMLVEYYREASDDLKTNPDVKEKIYRKMELIESGDKAALNDVKNSAKKMLRGMKESLKELEAEALNYYHESDLIATGKVETVIEKLKESEICHEEKGAYYLDLKEKKIAGRNQKFFFTRENGLSLYTTRDIAYHIEKFKNYDRAINILGEDHRLQSRLLEIALEELNSKIPEAVFYSFVNLPGGKMSTRAGRVVYLDDVMKDIVELASKKLSNSELDESIKKELAKQIGIGALRYNILKVQAEKGFTFNIDEALNLQGDSAPFSMYSHARASSILRNYGESIPELSSITDLQETEIKLLRTLTKWPYIIEKSVTNLSIHNIPNYVHSLSSDFNQFYRDCPVINSDNSEFRINLVFCSKKILCEGLSILGINAPERM